ncbi:putative cytochrome P450 301a1 [Blattella germanica]|nr:putative cytochrome P450 301a1 [Blattella germanica]
MFQRVICSSARLGPKPQKGASFAFQRGRATVAATQSVFDEWETAKSYDEVPGPKPKPLVGNLWVFIPSLSGVPKDFADQQEYFFKKYGDIVKISNIPGRKDMVMIFDADEIPKDTVETLGLQGEEWQSFRTKVNPIMMQPRATKIYVEPIDSVAEDFITRIRKLRDDKLEMPSNFDNELCKWALESIVYIALDKRMGCLDDNLSPDSEPQKMIDAVQGIFDSTFALDLRPSPWKIVSTPAWRKLVKSSDFFYEISVRYINEASERLKSLPKDSDRELTVLEKLLARDQNPKTAMTSFSTAVALYFLAQNPDKQEKLYREIQKFLPDKKTPVTSKMLTEMKYLKACLKESMRLRPIAIGNVRTTVTELVISGYKIPKGVDVMIPNTYLCKQEKYFSEPLKYIPERWLKTDDGDRTTTKITHPYVFLPFGFGPRMCLGRRFAELELETIVTKIIRNFQVEYNYGEMKFETKLLYTPTSPLKFKFVDRNN